MFCAKRGFARIFISILLMTGIFLTVHSGACAFDYVWWEAENYDESNWPTANTGTGPWMPDGPAESLCFSGGKWLNVGETEESLFASYNIFVPEDGRYRLYVRRFWNHGSFRWRLDGGTWNETAILPILQNVKVREFLDVSWISPSVLIPLRAGDHRFHFELHPTKGAGFDCFVLANGNFIPRGPLKPYQKSRLADNGRWAFEPLADDFHTTALMDLRFMNEDMAGENGYVRLSEDGNGFVDGNDEAIRFWGVNGVDYRWDSSFLRYQARRLAKLGVNMVRVYARVPAMGRDIAAVNAVEIDHFQRMVSIMKEEGIYISTGIYFPAALRVQARWQIEGYSQDGPAPYGMLFWNGKLQDAYKQWLRAFLTNPNPYTGIPLGQDPAVHIFQIQQDDSLFSWNFMQNIPLEQQKILGKKYGDWLRRRHGSLQKALAKWGGQSVRLEDREYGSIVLLGDHFSDGIAGFSEVGQMTSEWGRGNRRTNDQLRFLAETQRDFFKEIKRYISEDLNSRILVSPGNAHVADTGNLLDVERYTYSVGDVISSRRAFDSFQHVNPDKPFLAQIGIHQGDYFTDLSAMRKPCQLPVNVKQVTGKANIIDELAWPGPNRFQSEAPLLVSAYASMGGLDGLCFFSLEDLDFSCNSEKYGIGNPFILGGFPAAALLYRNTYVRESAPILSEVRPNWRMWRKDYPISLQGEPFDPQRPQRYATIQDCLGSDNTLAPLSYLVGPIQVDFGGGKESAYIENIPSYIQLNRRLIQSYTGELALDWAKGLCMMNTPRAQGACGWLRSASPISLDTIRIHSDNEYSSVIVVSMDGKPLSESTKILVQITTEGQLYAYRQKSGEVFSSPGEDEKYVGNEILERGAPPWNVVESIVTLAVKNPYLTRASQVDANGYFRKELKMRRRDQELSLNMPLDAMYVILH